MNPVFLTSEERSMVLHGLGVYSDALMRFKHDFGGQFADEVEPALRKLEALKRKLQPELLPVREASECQACNGNGKTYGNVCQECKGTGTT